MKAIRRCAYCNNSEGLTREHIIPKFVYTREEQKGRTDLLFNVRTKDGEKTVEAELTISDVCATCNNGFLSVLDGYGSELYDKYFDHTPEPGHGIKFEYDYNRLCRWLLKLVFNLGRSRHWSPELLRGITGALPFIRGAAAAPNGMRIYLQVIQAAELNEREKRRILDKVGKVVERIEPDFRRVLVYILEGVAIGYLVAMNAFVFHLVFWESSLPAAELRIAEKKFLRNEWAFGAKRLDPDAKSTVVHLSSLDIARGRVAQSAISPQYCVRCRIGA